MLEMHDISNSLKLLFDKDGLRKTAIPQRCIFKDNKFTTKYVGYLLDDTNAKGSRRTVNIHKHVDWLCSEILPNRKNYFLDIGCGVGHYTNYLCKLGHSGLGIDIMDAAIQHANKCRENNNCEFICSDFLEFEYPGNFDSVIFIYSVFNHLSITESKRFLKKVYNSLKAGGVFYFEPLTFITQKELPSKHWEVVENSIFCDEKQLSLFENEWNVNGMELTTYNYIFSSAGSVLSFYDTFQIYTNQQYQSLLEEAGFNEVKICHPPAINNEEDRGYTAIAAFK